MVSRSISELAGSGLDAKIRACLRGCQAMDVKGLAARVEADADRIRDRLDLLVARGEIEVIQPIFGAAGRRHYRLLRSDDNRYQWQVERFGRASWTAMSPAPVAGRSMRRRSGHGEMQRGGANKTLTGR